MDLMASKKSWLLAPAIALVCLGVILILWAAIAPQDLMPLFDNQSHSPVELMTLPLFFLIIPLVWLCPPNAGSTARQCRWSSLWSLLGIVAIIRETDVHKLLFAHIWPDIVFRGTVFKLKFLKAAEIAPMPKLFVLAFFIVFFVAVLIPLVRYFLPLIRGFFRFEPVAWTMATFGVVSTIVLVVDRLPAKLRAAGIGAELLDRETGVLTALLKAIEEGGELAMALLALVAILQSHLIFVRSQSDR